MKTREEVSEVSKDHFCISCDTLQELHSSVENQIVCICQNMNYSSVVFACVGRFFNYYLQFCLDSRLFSPLI